MTTLPGRGQYFFVVLICIDEYHYWAFLFTCQPCVCLQVFFENAQWDEWRNCTFDFNLSFGFFSQCSLHIHASYSISQKLNVPMAPLSEPNAVGIVIAHGKGSFCPMEAAEHALESFKKSHHDGFCIFPSTEVWLLEQHWGFFGRLPSEWAVEVLPCPSFPCPSRSLMGSNPSDLIPSYPHTSNPVCHIVLMGWCVMLQVVWGMPSRWWSQMCTSQMMGVTPGPRCWMDRTTTPSWTLEASLWPLSTAATLSMWLSMHELSSTHTLSRGQLWEPFCS